MIRLLCLAPLLHAAALRSRRSQGPNDEEFQDYLEDMWERRPSTGSSTVPTLEVKKVKIRSACTAAGECNQSRFAVPSQEDRITGANNCSDNHTLAARDFMGPRCLSQYGHLLKTCPGSNCSFYWLEIPSSGSSTMESMLYRYFEEGAPSFGNFTEKAVEGLRAFSFLRHPVSRFIGAYGRIVQYISKVPSTNPDCLTPELRELMALEEPMRFGRFVDLFIARGPAIAELYPCPENPCLFSGLLSQTWFLNLWPGPLDYLGHVESIEEDVKELGDLLGVELRVPMKKRRKMVMRPSRDLRPSGDMSLNVDRLLLDSGRMRKLHDYFRHDMLQLGYSPLPGFA